MPYLLNLAYVLLLAAASPWLLWAAWRKGKYRRGWRAKLWGDVPAREGDEPCIWIHAVSVGEVNLVAPLIAELRRRRPGWAFVLTSTTDAGLELAQRKYPDIASCYAPLDFSWAVRRAMRRIRPAMLMLVELELWPNLIRAASEAGASVAVVNGRLGERSFRGYRRIRRLLHSTLERIAVVGVQNEEYRGRFEQLGVDPRRLSITGSLKFDGACADRGNRRTRDLAELAQLGADDVVFLAGSTQAGEESASLDTYRALAADHPQLRLILVPRHPERFEEVAQLCRRSGLRLARRSEWLPSSAGAKGGATGEPWQVLLVDTVGELGAWWGTAQIAFVGGSFGDRGGQNMIEPAAYGAAVSFGPNTWNFRDIAAALLARDAAVVVADGKALTAFVRYCLKDRNFAHGLGSRAQQLVRENLGATARTADLTIPLVVITSSQPSLSAA